MNNYIINPMWFYWVNLLDALHITLIVIGIIGIVVSATFAFITYGIDDDDMVKTSKRFFKFIPWFTAAFVIGLLIPPKEVIYQMMVARYISEENLTLSVDAVKNAVDYIVQAFKGI